MSEVAVIVVLLFMCCALLCGILSRLILIDKTLGLLLGRMVRLTPDAERPAAPGRTDAARRADP